ncbi:MAG: PQQ-dependent sugar dehydrogenase, partial [Thioalkalivibrio sp.]|nr:PQQ-dependent sugar dehydrogenase [Thioalkalivibrio sp.]
MRLIRPAQPALGAPLLLFLLTLGACAAETGGPSATSGDYRVVSMTSELTHPWALAVLPDDSMLISERPG